MTCPCFAVDDDSLFSKDLYPGQSPVLDVWETLIDGSVLISATKDRAITYLLAKRRVEKLPAVLAAHGDWLAPHLLFAESLFWLEDYHSCLNELEWLRSAECLRNDRALELIVTKLRCIVCKESKLDEMYHRQEGEDRLADQVVMFVAPTEPSTLSQLNVDEISSVRDRWQQLESKDQAAREQFARLACVATNELECVFQLEGNSWLSLIRRGFIENAIVGVSLLSKEKKKPNIINILRSTLDGMNEISAVVADISKFDEKFICKLHSIVMKHCKFEDIEVDDMTKYRLLRIGEFRRVACVTLFQGDGTGDATAAVQFLPSQ